MKIKEITISDSLDTYLSGEKRSHFVSMKFNVEAGDDSELSESRIKYETLRLSQLVSESLFLQSLAKGSLTVEKYNEMLHYLRKNTSSIMNFKFSEYTGHQPDITDADTDSELEHE